MKPSQQFVNPWRIVGRDCMRSFLLSAVTTLVVCIITPRKDPWLSHLAKTA